MPGAEGAEGYYDMPEPKVYCDQKPSYYLLFCTIFFSFLLFGANNVLTRCDLYMYLFV